MSSSIKSTNREQSILLVIVADGEVINTAIKMNISNFKENLNYISYCGISLSPEEATYLENSLIILKSDNKFKETFFWGRINGIRNDYFIAFGYHKNCLTGSKFFYSVNCKGEWVLLPDIQPDNDRLCLLNQNLFQGDVGAIEDVIMVIFVFNYLCTISSISFRFR